MARNTNVSSLIPQDINKNLSAIKSPKAFGDQILNNEVSKLKTSALGRIETLKNDIKTLTQKIIDLEVNHNKNLLNLYNKAKPVPPIKPSLTEEEYQLAVNNENISYQLEKSLLQLEKDQLEQKLKDILSDPYKNVKSNIAFIKNKIKKNKIKNKNKDSKANKLLILKVLKNTGKSFVPIIALQGTKLIFSIISNNKKLQDLVDNTNAIIDTAVTQQDINSARVLRNSTLSILNDNERKLSSLSKLISTVNRILPILNIIIQLAQRIFPIPTPPGPIPDVVTPAKEKFRFKYETVLKLVEGLNVLLSILQGILDTQLSDLNDLKNQLKNINDLLDNAALNNLSDEELQSFINNIQNQTQPLDIEYKGFKLKIKEEETLGAQQAVIVRGTIRRKFAVAIDRDGVEVLKSELSFTLDPNDLIEQLKIIIDQQNLQA
jgi:hypothetical protein